GGIGSGKTAVAARLATHDGVRVVLADDLAKQIMTTDAGLRAALVARFGPETFRPDGQLDRARLAARVFADPAELDALDALVHPAVRRAMLAEIEAARAAGVRLVVYEAALLFEVGADALVDHIALVTAPEAARVARAMARDGASEADVRARMARQIAPDEAVRRTRAAGGTVLANDADLAALYARADALVASLIGSGGAAGNASGA
ncbi:MAG TPA: dephospho-CoA kinase, partial [Rubricoccaceae bacterium]